MSARVRRRGWTAAAIAASGTLTLSLALLAVLPPDQADATFPGLSGQVVYVGAQDNDFDLYAVDPAGGSPIDLTNTPDNDEHDPAWSPSGSMLAYARGDAHFDIWVMGADGSDPTNLTPGANDGGGNAGRHPTWSPDGLTIAYTDATDIWSMAPDGSGKQNLTDTPVSGGGVESDPVYSPDGERIAFVRGLDLWVMNSDGSDQHAVVESTKAERSPDWSPDGAAIVFERSGEIWTVSPDGSNLAPLVTVAAGGGTTPAYSPDGLRVAFSSSGFGAQNGPDIITVGTDGTGAVRLAGRSGLTDFEPAWQSVVDDADLNVTVVDTPDPVRVGGPVSYQVTVTNQSDVDARMTTLTSLLPSRAGFGSATADQGTCRQRRTALTCRLGTVPALGSVGVTVVVDPTSTFDIALAGTVTASNPDPDQADNSFDEDTEVLPPESEVPNPALTWTAPDRYADHDGDGLLDENAFNNPKGNRIPFEMVLSGCDSNPIGGITSYAFEVTLPGGQRLTQTSSSCEFAFEPPKEGKYPVTLTITTHGGETRTLERDVPFRDYFIVSLGDSIASGEGNPDRICVGPCAVPWAEATPAYWQFQPCHRSAISGPSRGARAIETADPTTSVTFVHLACSGAQVTRGILQKWPGIEPDGDLMVPPQANVLEALMKAWGRKPDAVLVSIGANDAEFAGAVTECLLPGRCQNNADFVKQVKKRIARLPDRYAMLDKRLDSLGIPGRKVFITEYPDVTRNEEGNFAECIATLFPSEWQWASDHVVDPLNAHVRKAANKDRHGWNVVGVHQAFRNHGYCSSASWIVRLQESFLWQGHEHGAFHPNIPGHQTYGASIAAALRARLE